MTRAMGWITLALALAACGGEGPKQVYYGMATAAEFGDLDTFLEGFTKESKQIVQAQLSLSDAYGLKSDNPVSLLVFSAVEEVEEKDDQAILTVTRGTVRKRILMVNVPEVGWRIDAKKLADFWEDEKKRK
ncbi:MAG: hypothetical protein IT385_16430 [Deltaproteobacteria bacterium]|nr:hypothetical protein [Deltaproteobacteria bacterium]